MGGSCGRMPMKGGFPLRAIIMLVVVSGNNPMASMEERFEMFKAKFRKNYDTAEEELKRFKIFVTNMETASKLEELDGMGAKYGHESPLADLSEMEFAERNTLPVTASVLKAHKQKAASNHHQLRLPQSSLPDKYDWREHGAVTDVKNQGQCGSCWAFGTVANLEGQNFLQNGQLISLSEQELVDCSGSDNGCNGGLPSRAFEDMIEGNVGLELEKDYGYEASSKSCRTKESLEKVFVQSWVAIGQDEDEIARATMKYGPLPVGLNAGPMQLYMGGIADPWFCSPSGIDHAVTVVGFGTEGSKPFWIIKNSWGAEWGEEGYYRLVRGKGKCGMNLMVTTAVVKKDDGKKGKDNIFV